MNTLVALSALLLVGQAATEILDRDIVHLNDSIYNEDKVIYTGKKEITRIFVPINSLNFDKNTDIEDDNFDLYVFFIEAESGLYVFKDDVATKVLDNGKDIGASMDDSKQVFIGATDGIYTFNAETKTAEKYGTLTDNIRNIVVTNGTDEIYILTEDRRFYKVIDEGTKKEEVVDVQGAQQVVFDNSNNLFFVGSDKKVYVKNSEDDTVLKVQGLPANPTTVVLLKPSAVAEKTVALVSDSLAYKVQADGESEFTGLALDNKPSAYSIESGLIIYYAHNAKIYHEGPLRKQVSSQKSVTPINSYLNDKSPNFKEAAIKKTLRQ